VDGVGDLLDGEGIDQQGAAQLARRPGEAAEDEYAILVAAASPSVPAPLVEQLAPSGRLVIPIGDRDTQVLQLLRKEGDRVVTTSLGDVRFVPLLGEFGFRPSTS